jgi:hypothetical protein
MRICNQCGEQGIYGGFAAIPGEDIFPKWRCVACMLGDVKKHFDAKGIKNPKALIVTDRKSEA